MTGDDPMTGSLPRGDLTRWSDLPHPFLIGDDGFRLAHKRLDSGIVVCVKGLGFNVRDQACTGTRAKELQVPFANGGGQVEEFGFRIEGKIVFPRERSKELDRLSGKLTKNIDGGDEISPVGGQKREGIRLRKRWFFWTLTRPVDDLMCGDGNSGDVPGKDSDIFELAGPSDGFFGMKDVHEMNFLEFPA